jgi:hypothetical protein
MVALGFVAHEVIGEVRWLDAVFHLAPRGLAAIVPAVPFGWIETLWVLVLFPLTVWGGIAGVGYLAGHRAGLRALLLAAATGAAPVLAVAHLSKTSAKLASWGGYLPLAIRDPQGIDTFRSVAAHSRTAPTAHAVEPLEEVGVCGEVDADSGIPDGEHDPPAVRARRHGDPDLPGRLGVLDGVVQQVDHRLAQEGLVSHHRSAGRRLDAAGEPLLLGERRHQLYGGRRNHGEIHRLAARQEPAGVGPRREEQPLHELGHAIHLLNHAHEGVAAARWQILALQGDLTEVLEDRQRGAQLVGRV